MAPLGPGFKKETIDFIFIRSENCYSYIITTVNSYVIAACYPNTSSY